MPKPKLSTEAGERKIDGGKQKSHAAVTGFGMGKKASSKTKNQERERTMNLGDRS
jgi:hypothetical protein